MLIVLLEEKTRHEKEKFQFKGPFTWTVSQMSTFVRNLNGGEFELISDSFQLSGKLFSIEWIGHVERRVVAAGGTEEQAHKIYDAFHDLIKQAKSKEVSKKGGNKRISDTRKNMKNFAGSFSEDCVVTKETIKIILCVLKFF